MPAHREVIYASGVAELICAAGLLHPRTRRLAGLGQRGACCVAVFPGNIKMAVDAMQDRATQTFKAVGAGPAAAAAPDDPCRAAGPRAS